MKHNRPTLLMAAALLLPATVMYGARFVGSAPSTSKAQSAKESTPEIVRFPSLNPDQDKTQPIAQDQSKTYESPFWFEQDTYIAFDENQAPNQPAPEVKKEYIPEFQLTSILPNPKNPLAIIDSKTFRIGDDLEGGWKLLTINGQTRTVILAHKSGKRVTLSLTKN